VGPEVIAGQVMVEIDGYSSAFETEEFIAGAPQFTDIQDKGDIKISVGYMGADVVRTGQETVQVRKRITVMYDDILAAFAQDRCQGKRGTDSISVRPFMGGQ
jgi:hypothetical protein